MIVPERLTRALNRLGSALDTLEGAAARRAEADAARANLQDELDVMGDDRARLAAELDGALARCRTLSSANLEVSHRLSQASVTVKAVLDDAERVAGPVGRG